MDIVYNFLLFPFFSIMAIFLCIRLFEIFYVLIKDWLAETMDNCDKDGILWRLLSLLIRV